MPLGISPDIIEMWVFFSEHLIDNKLSVLNFVDKRAIDLQFYGSILSFRASKHHILLTLIKNKIDQE